MNKRKRTIMEDAVPFKVDGELCRLLPVRGGYHTIVDAADYEWLCGYSWFPKFNRDGKVYVCRKGLIGEGWRGSLIPLHRFLLGLIPGDGKIGDHRDAWNTLNNSRRNLRIADREGNARNAELRDDSRTGAKGIQRRGNGSYRVRAYANGKRVTVGHCHSIEAAITLRSKFIEEHHGEFARMA